MKKKNENIDDEKYLEGIDPYQVDKLSKIPSWFTVLFLKYWAAAAAIFFGIIGGLDIGLSFEDMSEIDPYQIMAYDFVTIIMITLFTTLLINYPVRLFIRLINNRRNNTFKYNMVNCKGLKSFFISFVYIFIVSIILYFAKLYLKLPSFDLFGTDTNGLEPFSYGFYFIFVDSIFCIIKFYIKRVIDIIKYNRLIKKEV
ncbi:MAG: hypothetical protein MR357_06680 [Anaeroplasma sp.]|nr:hypothetical protein [Anaeroplasma sp.]